MPPGPAVADPHSADPLIHLRIDGADVAVEDEQASLLDVLRGQCGVRSAKDGCSPQGQCGCCTVWVDGAPRVACVTPVRRVAGREITTLEGLAPDLRQRWADALFAAGGSQCGFCTPGIVMRLASAPGTRAAGGRPDRIGQALSAHLCRCTGWQTVVEAARAVAGEVAVDVSGSGRDLAAANRRATIEGGVPQRVGTEVVLGDGGFADDTCHPDALVAVPDGNGGYAVGATLAEARRRAGKVQGRNIPGPLGHPVDVPAGHWDLTLRTTWVEPAYLETDASWCAPGAEPVSACANGGAFGGKLRSPVAEAARRLADELGRPVRVLWSREDVVRLGPKRPPVGAGVDVEGRGILRVGVTAHGGEDTDGDTAWDEAAWDEARVRVGSVAPGLSIEAVPVTGPRVSLDLRAALWAEAAVLDAAVRSLRRGPGHGSVADPVAVVAPGGGRAAVRWSPDGPVEVEVDAGRVLDEVVLRSYCIGAVHQALGWVLSEGIATDENGEVRDLTVRSFGILPARAMPEVRVTVASSDGPPVNGSDAVFAAAAAACWIGRSLSPAWPVERSGPRP
jgi:aerobic-type carbon monoxide dehydrogenase small subunit (CoxS/CutS family)